MLSSNAVKYIEFLKRTIRNKKNVTLLEASEWSMSRNVRDSYGVTDSEVPVINEELKRLDKEGVWRGSL